MCDGDKPLPATAAAASHSMGDLSIADPRKAPLISSPLDVDIGGVPRISGSELEAKVVVGAPSVGTFVGLGLHPANGQRLSEWLRSIGVPNPYSPRDLHATVIKSKTLISTKPGPPHTCLNLSHESIVIKAGAIKLVNFPNTKLLVLKFESEGLAARHAAAKLAGGVHDAPFPWTPHITVSNDWPPGVAAPSDSVPFDIVLQGEYAVPTVSNWTPAAHTDTQNRMPSTQSARPASSPTLRRQVAAAAAIASSALNPSDTHTEPSAPVFMSDTAHPIVPAVAAPSPPRAQSVPAVPSPSQVPEPQLFANATDIDVPAVDGPKTQMPAVDRTEPTRTAGSAPVSVAAAGAGVGTMTPLRGEFPLSSPSQVTDAVAVSPPRSVVGLLAVGLLPSKVASGSILPPYLPVPAASASASSPRVGSGVGVLLPLPMPVLKPSSAAGPRPIVSSDASPPDATLPNAILPTTAVPVPSMRSGVWPPEPALPTRRCPLHR